MNVSKITSSLTPIKNTLGKGVNKVADKIGNFVDKSDIAKKAVNIFEPNGGDNSFFGLASIMVFAVLIPRVITALRRNPEDKEATKDEITGILFRDVTTILTMLFALKTMNSVVSNIGTKMTGIPMVNKPFEKLFNDNIKGFTDKAKDIFEHPLDKAKKIVKNIGLALNPIGGSVSLSGDEINRRFTNLKDVSQVQKLLEDVPHHGGKPEKVFEKMKNSIIDSIKATIEKTKQENMSINNKFTEDVEENLRRNKSALKYFENLTYEKFMGIDTTSMSTDKNPSFDINHVIKEFFKDEKNPIALSAKRVNAWLRSTALAIEVFFLGFGLPTLNQKRLEKKYLSEKPIGEERGKNFTPSNDRQVKAQEIKLFSSFMK